MNHLKHVAFIMDGNGRWGKKRKKNRNFGHSKGLQTVKKIVKTSINFKIPIITFYVFSSENWKRPKNEINFLFNLINNYFLSHINEVVSQGIKLNILGEKSKLPKKIKKTFKKCELLTKKNKKITINLAFNYGSKDEIFNAFKKLKGKLNYKKFEENLYTKNMPNPDILIRTGGYQRLSNFMLWQLAYAELFFLKKLWPDFGPNDLKKIIDNFKKIKRNFGSI